MTIRDRVPNCAGKEYCPVWPEDCRCELEQPHIALPAIQAQCGHCDQQNILVPQDHKTPDEPNVRELVMAGAGYCVRCRKPLCHGCGNKHATKINQDCANKEAPKYEPMLEPTPEPIKFRWGKAPDIRTPYDEIQPTHELTCSNGMKAKLTRTNPKPPIYRGTIYDQHGQEIRWLEIHSTLPESKKTVEERIEEVQKEQPKIY